MRRGKKEKQRNTQHKREEKNYNIRLYLGLGKSKQSVLIEDWRNPQSEPEQPFIRLSSSFWGVTRAARSASSSQPEHVWVCLGN